MAKHVAADMAKWKKRKSASDTNEHARFCQMTTEERNDEYLRLGREAWLVSWQIVLLEDGWRQVAGQDRHTGCVFKQHFDGVGNVYRLEGFVDVSAQALFEELVIKVEQVPNWNSTVADCKTANMVGDDTDICYNSTPPYAGGLVAPRDFLNLRHWQKQGDTILSGGCYVWHPEFPPQKKVIRGENGPGGWVFREILGQPDKCIFMWIINLDLKGWLPQKLIDTTIPSMLMEYMKKVHQHVPTMKSRSLK